MFTPQEQMHLLSVVRQDTTLTPEEKQYLLEKMNDPTFFQTLVAGGLGGGAAYVIAKFLNIPPRGQILLSMAGFGIGKYLLDKSQKYDKFMKYNSKAKAYEINA